MKSKGRAVALAGAALCGAKRSVLLLADSAGDATMTALGANRGSVQGAYVLGGTSAVSADVESTVDRALGGGGTQSIDSTAGWSDTADYDGDGVNETFFLTGEREQEPRGLRLQKQLSGT